MKILYITFAKKGVSRMHLDPSVIYRCFNPASSFAKMPVPVSVIHASEVASICEPPSVIVCHRPQQGRQLNLIFKRFPKARMVADFDDLLFYGDSSGQHPALLSGRMSASSLAKETRRYFKAAERFREFTVSTLPIKNRILELFPGVSCHVLSNGWNSHWRAFGNAIESRLPEKKSICYFAGTSNHDQDLYNISEEISDFLGKNPSVTLTVYGDIDLCVFQSVASQVKKGTPVPFYLFPTIIRNAWVSIAPLIDSNFNACKSAIKFIESGLFGVPVIASRTADLERMSNTGLIFAGSKGQWFEALNKLLNEKNYREAVGGAREMAEQQSSDLVLEQTRLVNVWSV